jgi:signal peptidase II
VRPAGASSRWNGLVLPCSRMLATVGVVVALDQCMKALAVSRLDRGESVNVFLGLDLTHVRNEGVAFGALSGGGWPLGLVIAVALGALMSYFLVHASTPFLWAPVGVVLGGSLGNLADRAREGAVIDFVDPIAWPAFNLADAAIVVGVLGVLYVVEGGRFGPARG